jgi:hypothetical protein
VDEVRFGPRRETRLPSRYRRVFAVLVSAGAIAAGAALTVTAVGSRDAASGPRDAAAASPNKAEPSAASPRPASCPPAQTAPPNLAALPAGMRPGALKVIGDAQFSGRCGVNR